MRRGIKAFLSFAVLGRTLGALADDAVECYAIDAVNEITSTFNSLGLCASHCAEAGYSVYAVQGTFCSCPDALPSNDKKVDASQCNEPCPGYALDSCGGLSGYYSVGNITGLGIDSSSAASSSASTTASATTTIVSDGTASVTSSPTSPATATTSSSSTPSNNTVTATSSSTSGSSGLASPTVETSSADAPIFGKGATVLASVVSAVAVLVALV